MFSCVHLHRRFCVCAYLCIISLFGHSESILEPSSNFLSSKITWHSTKSYRAFERPFFSNASMMDAVGNSLKDEEVLIRYAYQAQSQRIKILIASPSGSMVVERKVPFDFNGLVDGFSNLLQQQSLARKTKRLQFIETSHQLYTILLGPIVKSLENKKHLIVIGDGVIQKIPFELLLECDAEKAYSELDFLVKAFTISYHFSEEGYLKSLNHSYSFDSDFFAFAPVFGEINGTIASNDLQAVQIFREGGVLNALPFSKVEVENIQALFQRNRLRKTKMLVNGQATKSALRNHIQMAAKFIHIASHSFADLENPSKSGIFCANKVEGNFGILSSKEIQQLSIKADLVVLSSCESGTEKTNNNKEGYGIHRSFVEAGAANVVFSNWKVNDKICKEFMIMFYDAILSGKSYSEAMQSAKIKLLKNPATACPNYWAAFSLVGR